MTTPQITPTPDAVKLATELMVWSVLPLGVGINQAEFHRVAREAAAALTAQQAEHAAVVARLEAASFAYDKLLAIHGTVLEDLSAARAEVERWKRDKDDAEERLIPLIELVEKHTLESEDSFDTEDVLEGHYKDRDQFRVQLTALRERAEADKEVAALLFERLAFAHKMCFRNPYYLKEKSDETEAALAAYRAAEGKGEQP